MTEKIGLITTSRQDLFNVAAILARGIAPEFLHDAQNPLHVMVDGDYNSGKKIFPDAMRHVLLSSTIMTSLRGDVEYDEYWLGQRNGKPLEVGFINLAWGRCEYSSDRLRRQSTQNDLRSAFEQMRWHGGVSFVHNADKPNEIEYPTALSIWLDRGVVSSDRLLSAGENVTHDFWQARKDNNPDWVRYVEISVHDERLAKTAEFQAAAEALTSKVYKEGTAYDRSFALKAKLKDRLVRTVNAFKA